MLEFHRKHSATTMKHRQLRVNELVKRELSAIIAREINFQDALVTVNGVNVTPDLKSAHVFVSTLGSTTGANVIDALEAHRPALQAELSRHVVLKYTPHLVFHLDDSIERGARVLDILQDLEGPRSEDA
jgi:ribosome-binding factor A